MIHTGFGAFARALALGLVAVAISSKATPVVAPGGLIGLTATIDFSQFAGAGQMLDINGPTQIGTIAGYNVTVQDMSGGGNIQLYDQLWSFLGNGSWNAGRGGFLGISSGPGPVRISFNNGPISGFGMLMNYPPNDIRYLPQKISAFSASGTLLEIFDIAASAPISTPGATNSGAFRGIQLSNFNIAYVELVGAAAAYDNFTFTVINPVPEPGALAIWVAGLAGLAMVRYRRRLRGCT